MDLGADVPGRITRIPGGVALNVAMGLRRFGLHPAILGAVGRDADVERVRRGQADAERAEDDHPGRADGHGGHVRSTPAVAVTPGDGAYDAHADAIARASLAVR